MSRLDLGFLAAGLVLAILAWTTAGWRRVSRTGQRAAFRGRLRAAAAALVPLSVLAVVASRLPGSGHVLVGVLAGAAFLVREALDPLREGFWHHRRLKLLGALASVGMGGLAAWAAEADGTPLVMLAFAGLAYHRHLSGAHGLFARSLMEIDGLSRKVRAQEAELRLGRSVLVQAEAEGPQGSNAERQPGRERAASGTRRLT